MGNFCGFEAGHILVCKNTRDVLEEGDFEILKEMKVSGKIELISQKDEDIYWIDLARDRWLYHNP